MIWNYFSEWLFVLWIIYWTSINWMHFRTNSVHWIKRVVSILEQIFVLIWLLYSLLWCLFQRENSSMWPQGPNSRTAVPSGTYFNYQGQAQQQPSEYGQNRQVPSNYGALGYPNFYHSQGGIAQDQPQNTRSVSQVQPKQSQNWQDMY